MFSGFFTVTKPHMDKKENNSSYTDELWLVIKNTKKNGTFQVRNQLPFEWKIDQDYELKENDIIKLGRLKFRVRELNSLKNSTLSDIENPFHKEYPNVSSGKVGNKNW